MYLHDKEEGEKMNSSYFCELSSEKLQSINGGIWPALIAGAIAAVGGIIALDLESEKQKGANEAMYDIYHTEPPQNN